MKGYQYKFIIQPDDPRDWLFNLTHEGETVHQFTWPEGPFEKNECSDTIYRAGEKVPYHEHKKGIETFLIAKGSVDVTIRGKHTVAHEGDIIFLAPYTAHGFIYLEEGTIWREFFQEINMSGGIMNKHTVMDNYGMDFYWEPEFRARYLGKNEQVVRIPPAHPEEVSREELKEIRTPEFGFSTFRFGDGAIVLRQKVGRWETNGVREVWQAILRRGVKVAWNAPYGESEIYHLRKGRLHMKIMDEEYTVEAGSFIHIPPYVKREMEVLEDGTELLDAGCSGCMLDMLEDYVTLQATEPEKLATPEARSKFMQQYGVYITDVSY